MTVDPQCKQFNYEKKVCTECYSGFKIGRNGSCEEDKSAESLDPNCKEWKNGVCVVCSFGAYKDSAGKCTLIDTTCKKFNI